MNKKRPVMPAENRIYRNMPQSPRQLERARQIKHFKQNQKMNLAKQDRTFAWRRKKLAIIFIIFLGFLTTFVYTIFSWQAIAGSAYEIIAMGQLLNRRSNNQPILANRGAIMDRNMQPLALSSTMYDVFLDIRLMLWRQQNQELTAAYNMRAITEFFDFSQHQFEQFLAIDNATGLPVNNTHRLIILRDIPPSTRLDYEEWLSKNDIFAADIHFEEGSRRNYIHNTLAAPILGFNRGEWWGLERQYNQLLSGQPGRSFTAFDSSGNILTERIPPLNGYTLVTTLDLSIQRILEDIVPAWTISHEASHGSAIVMNPHTGEILGMAQYPSFDANYPADISRFTSQNMSYYMQNLIPDSPQFLDNLFNIWANFNISGTYEPGSIYKSLTIAKALEEGLIYTNQLFYCSGVRHIAGHDIHCWHQSGHGLQTLKQVHANSCNVALMDIAALLGRDLFWQYQRDFGFGMPTGIDLPGENSGIVFSVTQLNDSELATSSFGQRFTATPLQTISSFASLINGGNIMQPHIVSRVLDDNGNIASQNPPHIQRRVISQGTSDWMRQAMAATITEGTGQQAAIVGYTQGGKTSTAEQGVAETPEQAIWSLAFIGYFPVENPQYLVQVVLHEIPDYIYQNNRTVAPMYRDIATEIIRLRNIPPNQDIDLPNILSINNFTIVENYVGMDIASVVSRLNSLGLSYEFIGSSGTHIDSQFPSPCNHINNNTPIILNISGSSTYTAPIPYVVGLNIDFASEVMLQAGFLPRVVLINPRYGLYSYINIENNITQRIVSSQKMHSIHLPTHTEVLLFVEIIH